MKLKVLIPIIAMVSAAAMIIWGTLGNAWNVSWIAVFVGGIAMAIISVIAGAKEKEEKEKAKAEEAKNEEK